MDVTNNYALAEKIEKLEKNGGGASGDIVASIAEPFDATASYSMGDFAMIDSTLSTAIEDIEPGELDPTKWLAVNVMDEVVSVAGDVEDVNARVEVIEGNYSTTPRKNGRKWVDGADIYEVVVAGTYTEDGLILALEGVPFDRVIRIDGTIKNIVLNLYADGNNKALITADSSKIDTDTDLYLYASSNYAGSHFTVVVEYAEVIE